MIRYGLFVGAAVVVVALIALMSWALSNRTSVTGLSGVTRVTKPAPDFTLDLMDGGQLLMSELAGSPVVINFWASWCTPCRTEAAGLERTWRDYEGRGVVFVGIDIQDSEANARFYLEEFDVTYPNGRDENGTITVDYGVVGLPVTFFVSKEGVIERRWVGAIPESRLLDWTESLARGLPLSDNDEAPDPDLFRQLR
jgi:cytochrome c biogenesis protein CcmG, thiol:disulfide interchange protein DsbE